MIKVRTYGNLYMTVLVNDIIYPVYYPRDYVEGIERVKLAKGYSTSFKGQPVSDIVQAYIGFYGLRYSELIVSPRGEFNDSVKIMPKDHSVQLKLGDGLGHVKISVMREKIAEQLSEWIDTNFE